MSARTPSIHRTRGALALLALAAILVPEPATGQDGPRGLSPALGLTLGTSGLGAEFSARPHERLGARLGVSWIPIDVDIDEDDVTGTASPPSPIVRLTADFYPGGGGFHLSAGIHHYSGGVSAHAIARDSVEVGDAKYSAEEFGEARAKIWGSETAPYLGLGWQATGGRIQPYFELGAALTGSPKVSIDVLGPAGDEIDFEEELAKEIREIEDDVSAFKVYPHLMLGLRMRLGG